ncbi:MAG: hypothetical protein QNL04_12315 [SAR324 cluster bacterium]|nr:hypothetical protein [SAR324 cluster bacterium]
MKDANIELLIRESLSGALALAKEISKKITMPLDCYGKINICPGDTITFKPLHGCIKKVTAQNLEARILELSLAYNWKPELLYFK